MPDDVELVSISIFLITELPFASVVSGVDSHGFVLIRHRCRGDGAVDRRHWMSQEQKREGQQKSIRMREIKSNAIESSASTDFENGISYEHS